MLEIQAIVSEEFSGMLRLLYFIVLLRAKLHEVSRAISPIDPHDPSYEGAVDKAFKALVRKSILRRIAKSSQRFDITSDSTF